MMENIGNYLQAVKKFGIPVRLLLALFCVFSHFQDTQIFVTVDLFEAKNMLAVLQHFLALKAAVTGQLSSKKDPVPGNVFNKEY